MECGTRALNRKSFLSIVLHVSLSVLFCPVETNLCEKTTGLSLRGHEDTTDGGRRLVKR